MPSTPSEPAPALDLENLIVAAIRRLMRAVDLHSRRLVDEYGWHGGFLAKTADQPAATAPAAGRPGGILPAFHPSSGRSHPQIHRELFEKIRYTEEEAERLRTGLEIDRLGAGPGAKYIMKFLSSWPRMKTINKVSAAHFLAKQTAFLARSSSGLVGIWIKQDTPENWIHAGKVIEQLWIKAHHLGIEVQPLPVAAYLKRKWDTNEEESEFQQSHAEHMNIIIETLADFTRNADGLICTMVFRVGKALPMKNIAIRKAPSSFLSQ